MNDDDIMASVLHCDGDEQRVASWARSGRPRCIPPMHEEKTCEGDAVARRESSFGTKEWTFDVTCLPLSGGSPQVGV